MKFLFAAWVALFLVNLTACSQGEDRYVARYVSKGNSEAYILLTLQENKAFKLNLEIINIDKKNDFILYKGRWKKTADNTVTIIFDEKESKKNNPKLLFYDGDGNKMPGYNSVSMINDYAFTFNLEDKCIFIWNIMSCKNQ